MKRTGLLNSELSYIISKLGHFDALTVCDAGLPVPEGVQRIDLAVSEGIPSFIDVVKAVLMEMELESVELAEEFRSESSAKHDELLALLEEESKERGKDIPVDYVRHVAFKLNTKKSVAIVRTGEFTPYANITFKAGVVF
ncbi:D-ribose pyranase [Maridesulfovibrio sp.]|uniref:D-ribose pyranase n=1 Tax=Maridesulfovibrio sp. TaxID=2795000 RepID=UPI002A18B029|nr:D-ribose pyranase [Maridesulfovibrio sp.]